MDKDKFLNWLNEKIYTLENKTPKRLLMYSDAKSYLKGGIDGLKELKNK